MTYVSIQTQSKSVQVAHRSTLANSQSMAEMLMFLQLLLSPNSMIPTTPKHASWLNTVGIELSAFARQCADQRFDSRAAFEQDALAWAEHRNRKAVRNTNPEN
jgi:hypothetical protein